MEDLSLKLNELIKKDNAPHFDGKSMLFSKWASAVNKYFAEHYPKKSKALSVLPSLLTNEALDAYNNLPETVKNSGKYHYIMEEFHKALYSDDLQKIAASDLEDLQQGASLVEPFFKKCEELSEMAWPGETLLMTKATMCKKYFIEGLHDRIREHVRRANPKTAQEALSVAKNEQAAAIIEDKKKGLTASPYKLVPSAPSIENCSENRQNTFLSRVNTVFDPTEVIDEEEQQVHHLTEKKEKKQNEERSGSLSGKSSSVSCSSLLFVSMLMACFGSTLVSQSDTTWSPMIPQTFHDCAKSEGSFLMVPPRATECTTGPTPQSVRRGVVSMFVQNATIEQRFGWKCSIEITDKSHVNYFFWTETRPKFRTIEKPTARECRIALEDHVWRKTSLHIEESGFMASDWVKAEDDSFNFPLVPYKSLWRRITLERGIVSKMSDGKVWSTLMPIDKFSNCSIESGVCATNFEILMWNDITPRSQCDLIKTGSFNATIGDKTIILEEQQVAYQLDDVLQPKNIELCFKHEVLSSKGVVFFSFQEVKSSKTSTTSDQLPETTLSPHTDEKERKYMAKFFNAYLAATNRTRRFVDDIPNVQPKFDNEEVLIQGRDGYGTINNINFGRKLINEHQEAGNNMTNDLYNARNSYNNIKTDETQRENFRQMLNAVCQIRNNVLTSWLGMLEINPSVAVRMFYNRTNLIASFTGHNVLQVTQCADVLVTHIKHPNRSSEICLNAFDALTDKDEKVHIRPGSRFLHYDPSPVDCKLVPNYIHQDLNGTWKGENEEVHEVTTLEQDNKMPRYQKSAIVFYANDIYSNSRPSLFPFYLAVQSGANGMHANNNTQSNENTDGYIEKIQRGLKIASDVSNTEIHWNVIIPSIIVILFVIGSIIACCFAVGPVACLAFVRACCVCCCRTATAVVNNVDANGAAAAAAQANDEEPDYVYAYYDRNNNL